MTNKLNNFLKLDRVEKTFLYLIVFLIALTLIITNDVTKVMNAESLKIILFLAFLITGTFEWVRYVAKRIELFAKK